MFTLNEKGKMARFAGSIAGLITYFNGKGISVMLKLVCIACGVTMLESSCSNFFPLCCFSYVHCC